MYKGNPFLMNFHVLKAIFPVEILHPFPGFLAVAKSSKVVRVQHNENVLYSCDFDAEDICQFQHDKSNDVEFSWTKLYSATPSENTGPPHDASESKNG